jgi:hypothetical protein
MPDLLDELRRYGDALEREVAPLVRVPDTYGPEGSQTHQRSRRQRVLVLVAALAFLVTGVVVALAVERGGNPQPDGETKLPTVDTTPAPPPVEVVPDATTWTKLPGGPLAARQGHSMIVGDGRLLLWGGVVPETSNAYADGAQFSLATRQWSDLPEAPLSPRADHVAVWTGTEMVVWGGWNRSAGGERVDGAAYSPTSRSWRRIAPSPLPEGPRYAGVWTGSELVVLGASQTEAHGAAYDPKSDQWRSLPPTDLRTSVNFIVSLTWTGTRLVAFDPVPQLAGAVSGVQVFSYDPATDTWADTRITDLKEQALGGGTIDGLVYLVGYGGSTVQFDAETLTWEARGELIPAACEDIPAVRPAGSKILISLCGRTVFYDPASRQLRTLSPPEGVRLWLSQTTEWADGMLVTWQPPEWGGNLETEVNEESAVWMFAPARP